MENYKQKYMEALSFLKDLKPHMSDYCIEKLEGFFPELAEREDEKMIKSIKEVVEYYWSDDTQAKNEIIAWLEKQGEQKPFDYENAIIQQKDFAPKKEPKFKVGDWIVTPDDETKQVEKVGFGNYYFTDKTLYNIIDTDNKGYLWTIKDAKDGDVLVASDGSIFLFKCVIDCACKHYVALTTDDVVKLNDGLEHYWETSKATHPATKEQRELLFEKMKEAGYEWDDEKKELRKVEQKFTWSEEDERTYNEIIGFFLGDYETRCKTIDKQRHFGYWLKSLKDRVQPQPKQEWSDFDEQMLEAVLYDGENALGERHKEWIKNLKYRVQPQPKQEWSEEDEKMLNTCLNFINIHRTKHPLAMKAYDWLKFLKNRIKGEDMKANEAPERIYISLIPSISGGYVYTTVNKDSPNAVEYIRKDTLLRWAKEKDLSSVLHHPDRHYILVELIKKIESL